VAALTEVELLAMWEAGLGQAPTARALTLAAAAPDWERVELANLSLGQRDALLLSLRERCFGERLGCEVSCPSCDERLELDLTTADVRVQQGIPQSPQRAQVAGVEVVFRPVTSSDLLALDLTASDARRRLVGSCVIEPSEGSLDDDVIEAVAARLGEADPQADIVLSLACSTCQHEWCAPFDVGGYLWMEVDAYARRLLYEVRTLALAYGWNEADVLAVSPVRRRFYLEASPA
jgi:hypothetical protein